MDPNGAAALITALSGLVVSLTGIVLAYRRASPQGDSPEASEPQVNVNTSLPPDFPTPGKSVATGTHS